MLSQFLAGGIPGVLVGCALARKVSARKLKLAVATIAIFAGLQLIWSGTHTLLLNRAVNVTKIAAAAPLPSRNNDWRTTTLSIATHQDDCCDRSPTVIFRKATRKTAGSFGVYSKNIRAIVAAYARNLRRGS